MPDRKEFELTPCPADSESEIREIDTCIYGDEHVPRGYMRMVGVGEQKSPTAREGAQTSSTRPTTPRDVPTDERFENEKL